MTDTIKRQAHRAAILSDTEAFLASGGKINTYEQGETGDSRHKDHAARFNPDGRPHRWVDGAVSPKGR
jgi:hypothetical protein